MSNLAYKYSHQQQKQPLPKNNKKQASKIKSKITLGEKLLILLFVAFIIYAGVKVVSNQVALYNVNKEIQTLEASIKNQQKINNDLKVQKEELSSYERILAKGKELGLKLNENNVKVVQD